MFGLPDQSEDSWQSELVEVLSVCDDHVSLYQMTLERGTHLFKQVQLGKVHVPGGDVTATMYKTARNILKNLGFLQYEVSNFTRNNAVSTITLATGKHSSTLVLDLNIVNNYTEAEIKVREATCNDPWGPPSSLMMEITDLTFNVVAFTEVMGMV
ncbi:hypothetical protein AOLI_G00319910 [Acnodon oligacanthus]